MHLFDPYFQGINSAGHPQAGAKLYFYATGTTTPLTVYQDSGAATPHANPVVADAAGIFAPIYVSEATYKTVLKTSSDVTIQTIDPHLRGGFPTSSVTDEAVARFDGTTGVLQGSSVTLSDAGIFGLPSGGGFNFNGGNLTVTHSSGLLTYTGNLTIDNASDATMVIDKGASGDVARLSGKKAGVQRWIVAIGNNTAESGSNVGSDFAVSAYDDSGTFLSTPIFARRSTGVVRLDVGQLEFPGTQNASTDVNTLDDYEEGTFTPTIDGTSSAGAGTYTIQTGGYTKIGNRVFGTAQMTITAHTGTGNMIISGLPFSAGTAAAVTLRVSTLTSSFNLQGYTSGTTIILETAASGGAATALAIDTACAVMASFNYRV